MNEKEVREHVKRLRRFYTDVFIYLVTNCLFILIWAFSSVSYFWPFWSIIGWGIGLGIHAFSLGLLPQMIEQVPFLTADWEDEEVHRVIERKQRKRKKAAEKSVEKDIK